MRPHHSPVRKPKNVFFSTLAIVLKIVYKPVEKFILSLYPSLENANVLTLPTHKTDAAQGACAWS